MRHCSKSKVTNAKPIALKTRPYQKEPQFNIKCQLIMVGKSKVYVFALAPYHKKQKKKSKKKIKK